MKNKKRSILIAAVCVVLLAAALVLLLIEPQEQQPEQTHEHEHTSQEDYTMSGSTGELLIELESSQISNVVLRNETGTYTMRFDGSTYSIDEYGTLPVNQSLVDMAWYYATVLGYSNLITMQDGSTPPLEQYGLDTPAAEVSVSLTDGSGISYRVGRAVPDSEGMYYYTIDGYAGVFITELSPALFLGDSYWLSDELYTDAVSSTLYEIGTVSLSGEAFSSPVTISPVTGADAAHPYYSYDYVQTAPFSWACDNYRMTLLEYELAYMTANEAMCAFPSADELAAYGLDSPRLTVRYVRSGVEHTLRCSRVSGDYFYILFDERECIYRLDTASYEVLSSVGERTLLSSDVHVRTFEAVDSITVSTAQESFVFTLQRIQPESGLASYFAYCGEREITLAAYKDLLETFNSAICVEFGAVPAAQEPEVTVTVSYFDSFARQDDVITYTPTDSRRYACSQNGVCIGAVSDMWLDSLISASRTLAQS